MRIPQQVQGPLDAPRLLDQASTLVDMMRRASRADIMRLMKISADKAKQVDDMYKDWSPEPARQTAAIDIFVGDIYSGLQVQTWTEDDRRYAHRHLLILSGLYGGIRACDGIMPYRLEMGYKLPDGRSLYTFWGAQVASLLTDPSAPLINLSAVEYTKAVLPYADAPVITPKFLTVSPKTGEPVFVTVHAKIARGAFARWLITQRIEEPSALPRFADLGYRYDASRSTPEQPVFVCQEFKGLGLSVRLTT